MFSFKLQVIDAKVGRGGGEGRMWYHKTGSPLINTCAERTLSVYNGGLLAQGPLNTPVGGLQNSFDYICCQWVPITGGANISGFPINVSVTLLAIITQMSCVY